MKILVAVKQVATLEEDFEIRADGQDVDPDFLVHDMNEWDDSSLEEAVTLKEAAAGIEVIVVTVAPAGADEILRKCLAKGADRAVRIWDAAIAGSDSMAIARVLAAFARLEAPDLVFAGVQSSDQGFAATGMAIAGFLNWPHAAVINDLKWVPGSATADVRRELEGGQLQDMNIDCPAVLTIQLGINAPRYASLRSIKQAAAKTIDVIGLAELDLGIAQVGATGSSSRVRRMYVPDKARARMIEGTVAEQAAQLANIIRDFKDLRI